MTMRSVYSDNSNWQDFMLTVQLNPSRLVNPCETKRSKMYNFMRKSWPNLQFCLTFNIRFSTENSGTVWLIFCNCKPKVLSRNLIYLVHFQDEFPPSFSEYLQQRIREKFINVTDPEKCGLPKVLDSVEVSSRSKQNIKLLANLIYDTAFSLKTPGEKIIRIR